MTLLELSTYKGVYIDEEDLLTYGHHTASLDTKGYISLSIKGFGCIQLHKLLLVTALCVDHRNRKPSDCRKTNLRPATYSNNQHNRTKPKNNTSGYKGVSYHKNRGKYVASIGFEGKQYHLGSFNTAIEAAKAYNEGALKYHKEFAVLNDLES